jgi:lysophospholipase L1-like esterase
MRPSILCALLSATTVSAVAAPDEVANPSAIWEEEILAFEASDRQNPPLPGSILFVGSSSIRLWDLEKHFLDVPTINRGFGGSEIADSLTFTERIVVPYRPRAIVIYAGDNDIAAGKSPGKVAEDFAKFVKKVRSSLAETPIFYISIKPSTDRWTLYEKMADANRRIESLAADQNAVYFVDIATKMLNEQRRPESTFFVEDGLHLSEQGYELWTRILREKLDALRLLPVSPAPAAQE